ncbi:MAG TPA: SRPBCC family protein [Kofleriaceae bacterium]|nr:SRPBCC family protein [Kofleriaceae bacterium]
MGTHIRLAAIVAGLVHVAEARADPVVLSELPNHVTAGSVTIDAPPAEVYREVTEYARWPRLFGDVEWVRVESGGPRDAKLWFHSRIFGHDFELKFDNDPGRAIRFLGVGGPPGAHAHGEYVFQPIDGGKRTRVDANLYVDVSGFASILMRPSRVTAMRRDKLRSDLADTAHHFEHAVGSR